MFFTLYILKGLNYTFSKIERGENFVDVLLFSRWCAACGVKAGRALDELLKEDVQVS
jgi:hypothetical protein